MKKRLRLTLKLLRLKFPLEICYKSDKTNIQINSLEDFYREILLHEGFLKKNNVFECTINNNIVHIEGFNSYESICRQYVFQDYGRLRVNNKTVFDVGSYVGETAIYFAARGASRVISFEPFPYSFQRGVENIKMNRLEDRVLLTNVGIGGGNRKLLVSTKFENTVGSSILDGDGVFTNKNPPLENFTEIEVRKFSEVIASYDFKNAVLKMNCEGCEYEVFKSINLDDIRQFSEIQMHFHGDPEPLMRMLKLAGFKVHLGLYIYANLSKQ